MVVETNGVVLAWARRARDRRFAVCTGEAWATNANVSAVGRFDIDVHALVKVEARVGRARDVVLAVRASEVGRAVAVVQRVLEAWLGDECRVCWKVRVLESK